MQPCLCLCVRVCVWDWGREEGLDVWRGGGCIPSPWAVRGQTYHIMFVLGDKIGFIPCRRRCMLMCLPFSPASLDGLQHPLCAMEVLQWSWLKFLYLTFHPWNACVRLFWSTRDKSFCSMNGVFFLFFFLENTRLHLPHRKQNLRMIFLLGKKKIVIYKYIASCTLTFNILFFFLEIIIKLQASECFITVLFLWSDSKKKKKKKWVCWVMSFLASV